uniref:Uncharacterized protein n=1 Tax=Megaselia scalaris TaxID=36166 RepID=T1H5N1_MEGSC
ETISRIAQVDPTEIYGMKGLVQPKPLANNLVVWP